VIVDVSDGDGDGDVAVDARRRLDVDAGPRAVTDRNAAFVEIAAMLGVSF